MSYPVHWSKCPGCSAVVRLKPRNGNTDWEYGAFIPLHLQQRDRCPGSLEEVPKDRWHSTYKAAEEETV